MLDHQLMEGYHWRHYRGQCDYFAVYCASLERVYLVPVDEVGKTRAHLRIEPTKNNQEKNVRWARDYELSMGPAGIEPATNPL